MLLEEGFGKYEESEKLKRQALAILKKVYGEEHPNVATDLNNLAGLLYTQVRGSLIMYYERTRCF